MNNKNSAGSLLEKRLLSKKIDKATKAGKFLYKCLGGAEQPRGCGNIWSESAFSGHSTKCPKCENKYFKWLNYCDDK